MSKTSQKTDRIINISTPSDTEILLEGFVKAPRKLVYKAHIDPKAIPNWFGPTNKSVKVIEMDVKDGGVWKFVQVDKKGNEIIFHGKYIKIIPLKLIKRTINFGLETNNEFIETIEFKDLDKDQTKILITSKFKSKEIRDLMLQNNFRIGFTDAVARLEDFIQISYSK